MEVWYRLGIRNELSLSLDSTLKTLVLLNIATNLITLLRESSLWQEAYLCLLRI